METFHPELAANPLRSRADAVQLLLDLCRPLRSHYNATGSLLHIGSSGAIYCERTAGMEGWARVLWGLGPLFAQIGGANNTLPPETQAEIEDWAALYRRGLASGTDPESEGYWGPMGDFDQKMVETAALDTALLLAPKQLWEPLSAVQKQNVYRWLAQINAHELSANNWVLFRVLTNITFTRLGLPADAARLAQDTAVVEHCYLDEGWYFDGHPGQMDYYIPFAMHFYTLLWASFGAQPPYAETLLSRSDAFAGQFIHWFADDGAEIPFGRSLTYRFAHSAFFAALALTGQAGEGHTLPWGAVRHALLQNLRHWMQYPITDTAGVLSIGYTYPNLVMSECYNAPGSPYWAFKAFLFLALPTEHPFWQCEERTVPHPAQSLQRAGRSIVCHDVCGGTDHVTLYPTGQHSANHGNCTVKYQKFVYSNRFGFSIPRGETLDDGSFDCALALSPAGLNRYRMRDSVEEYRVCEAYNYTRYHIFPNVQTETWLVPCGGAWHIRIHKITNETPVDFADGGFGLPTDEYATLRIATPEPGRTPGETVQNEYGTALLQPWGGVGIFSLTPCAAGNIRTFPNCNIMAPLVTIPTLTGRLQPGTHLLVHSVFGDVSAMAKQRLAAPPRAEIHAGGSAVTVQLADGGCVCIPVCGEALP